MQELKLETLTRQGEPDPCTNCSITVTREFYNSLSTMGDEDFSHCNIEKGHFEEIYRDHTRNDFATHIALIISYPEPDKMPWNIVWVEEEALWIAFKYINIIDPAEAYGSTVEIAEPQRSDVYKVNDYVAELLRQTYKMNVPLKEVYHTAPKLF